MEGEGGLAGTSTRIRVIRLTNPDPSRSPTSPLHQRARWRLVAQRPPATEEAPPGSGAKLSIMHGLAGEAANPRPKHRAAQLVSMSGNPTQDRWFHLVSCHTGLARSLRNTASPPPQRRAAQLVAHCAGTRMKKPRSDAGLFPIPDPAQWRVAAGRDRDITGCGKNSVSQKPLVDFRARDLARKRPARSGANSTHEGLPRGWQTHRNTTTETVAARGGDMSSAARQGSARSAARRFGFLPSSVLRLRKSSPRHTTGAEAKPRYRSVRMRPVFRREATAT